MTKSKPPVTKKRQQPSAAPTPAPHAFVKALRDVTKLYDENGKHTGKFALTVKTFDGTHVVELDAVQLNSSRVDELARVLVQLDLFDGLPQKELKALASDICSLPKSNAIALRRTGYHVVRFEDFPYECLVWNNKIHWITTEPSRKVLLLGDARNVESCAGTLPEWKAAFNKILVRNPYLLVMFGAALSAALVRMLQLEPLQLIVVGESSSGKTASQRFIKSMFGAPQIVQSASGSTVGLQQYLTRCPDQPAVVQEMRQLRDPAGLIALMFELANQAARQIGTADQSGLKGANLATVLVGSNESTLAEMAMVSKVSVDAGLDARLFELVIPSGKDMYDFKPKDKDGAALSEHLESKTCELHGSVWPAWLKYVADQGENFSKNFSRAVKVEREKLTADLTSEAATWKRLARGVGVWHVCLRMARKANIIDIEPEKIATAIKVVWDERLQRLRKGSTPLGDRAIAVVRHAIETRPSKFVSLAQYNERPHGVMGYHGQVDGRRVYLFIQTQMQQLVGNLGSQAALRELKRSNFLIAKDGLTVQKRIPGDGEKRVRYYAIDASILEDNE